VSGVKSVVVDFGAKTATVETSSAEATPEKLLEALAKTGLYTGKVQ
jgi:copper chaperone CopZ